MKTFWFTYAQKPGKLPPTQALSVSVENNVKAIKASLTSSQSWLTISKQSGTTPFSLQVGVNSTVKTFAPGMYAAQITATAPEAVNSPQVATVTLEVRRK